MAAAAHGSDEVVPITMTHLNPAYVNDALDGATPSCSRPATSSSSTEHQAPEGWDTTQIKLDSHQDSSSQDWDLLYKFIRVVVCSLFFCLVLLTATVSKLSLLVMVSNIHVARDVDVVFRNATDRAVSSSELVINVHWIWALLCVTTLPYIFIMLSSLWAVLTMISGELHLLSLILALIPEVLHTGGLNLFIFYVLPSFDPIAGLVLTVSVGTLPGILNILRPVGCQCDNGGCRGSCTKKCGVRICNTLMFLLHLAVIACLTYQVYVVRRTILLTCLMPISLVLISISYWDNFVPKLLPNHDQNTTKNTEQGENKSNSVDTKSSYSGTQASSSCSLSWVKTEVGKRASKANLCIFICKICFTLGLAAVYFNLGNIDCWKTFFFVRAQGNRCSFNADVTLLNKTIPLPWILASVSVVSSALCYKISKYACKIQAQQLCFAVPLILSFISALCILGFAALKADYVNEVVGATVIQKYFHASDVLTLLKSYTHVYWIPVGLGSMLYLMFGVGFHIWIPKCNRMSPTWRLFQKPLYCGVLLDVSLILSRSREEQWSQPQQQVTSTYTPMIHLCATMWQEELREMVQLIKSMLRLDIHQSNFRASTAFGIESKDSYNFDANIFFDNAFIGKGKRRTVNKYVQRLHRAIKQACREVFTEEAIELDPPKKVKTAYGGILEYTLPNDNKLMVHLKDSSKIRRKKRWSQVMYMYYFLKHGITDNSKYKPKEAEEKAQNTFLLALDGDVDFQPDALRILLDRMKVNPYIGAVCGRIHPVGTGPMVWYQRFEYAVSHWLQKASENMLGCVLCSPGCFSLFRGSALMDTNVMRAYTKTVSEAAEKIQYDLGEDRWLCTLLLQQGHRVEYSAASDSFTFAPMDFMEFFKQRRRWTPSTMVNVLDLIMSWRTTTRNNSDISILYIIYQLGLFVSSVVTPGTVFMLIVGALSSSFESISLTTSFLINLAPLVLFVILCFKTSTKTQLTFALVLTVCYCLLMTVVLVGIIKQAAESGFCSISTIFLTGVAGIFVISALLHPQEFPCLFHGVLYFLLIPSTTLLMVIYSLVNLNDVSWGTRDSGESSKVQEKDEPKKKMNVSKKLLSLFLAKVTGGDGLEAPLLEGNEVVEDNPSDENITQRNTSEEQTDLTDGDKTNDNDLLDPYRGLSKSLSEEEKTFWSNLISEYLEPIDEKDDTLTKNLDALRNTACLGFILINAVFIVLLFALESIAQHTPNLAFELPCPDPTFKPEKVQPLSIAFIVVFGLLLLVQFIAMLFHRFSTLLQIIAGKEIQFSGTDSDVQLEELKRLIHDYENKSSDTTTISTDDEKKEDRRRRYQLKSIKSDLGNRDLWRRMSKIAIEMYLEQNSEFSLEKAVRNNFENLSLMSRKTIEILLRKTFDELLKKGDNKKLMPFTEMVLADLNKSGLRVGKKTRGEPKTLNSVFGLTVYDRKRRRPTPIFGGTFGSDGYCSGTSRNTTVSQVPTSYSPEIDTIEEIEPDYDS